MNQIDTSQLVELQNGEVTTTSLQVAIASGKNHKNVLEAIDNIIEDLGSAEKSATLEMFQESTYIHEQNHQSYRMYVLNRDGWTMLMGYFKGKRYTMFRYKYMKQFNAMEAYIKEQEQHSFFIPETVDQQLTREKLAISRQRSVNARSREVRAWAKLTDNSEEVAKAVAPKMLSQLLDIPEVDLLETK
ncbi:phage regulatory protein [Weissella oryzae SG25]|uniref:Phage regulatory protein n=1 Tax=Weissella oryzae (strain DSM 25784 / JCM 18191 / LMG 30913 / SG25) TaxID=1329250 RepID=A0A069CW63_WEIOS|nr:Rha family transcriptional regulator [Weissella oryzae]GAK31704.1 phage regulatory protein [Weissella oryzae SG25]